MLAAGFDHWNWTFTAIAILTVLWIAVRIWLNRGSAQSRALRHKLTDGSLSPRNHHYYFAHAALRALAFEDPDRLVIAMAAPEAEDFLNKVWQDVGEMLRQQGEDLEFVSPDGLEAIPARIAGRPVALIRLPAPRATTEAFFVAIVLNHDIDEPAKPAPHPPLYYFTLERGFSLDDSVRTVFCEWTSEAHCNYGGGPAPDPRAFLDHIAKHLAKSDADHPQPAPKEGETKE